MQEKINRDTERKESEFVKDPSSLWTIETKTRELDERKKQQQTNNEVKNILDGQVRFMNENRAQQQKNDFDTGSDLISQDLQLATREAQIAAFKRHEITKQLREAWTQQQIMKNTEKSVAKIF